MTPTPVAISILALYDEHLASDERSRRNLGISLTLAVAYAASIGGLGTLIGTPTNAGNFFLPFAQLHTGALTVDNLGVAWIDIDGAVTVPPGAWCSVAASATASTTVAHISMIWEELPYLV